MKKGDIEEGQTYVLATSYKELARDPRDGIKVKVIGPARKVEVSYKLFWAFPVEGIALGFLEHRRWAKNVDGCLYVNTRYFVATEQQYDSLVADYDARRAEYKAWVAKADVYADRLKIQGLSANLPARQDMERGSLRVQIPWDRLDDVLALLEGSD